jgi:hypothetical protein
MQLQQLRHLVEDVGDLAVLHETRLRD